MASSSLTLHLHQPAPASADGCGNFFEAATSFSTWPARRCRARRRKGSTKVPAVSGLANPFPGGNWRREQRPVRWPTETRPSLATRSGHQSACGPLLTARKPFSRGSVGRSRAHLNRRQSQALQGGRPQGQGHCNRHPPWRAPGSRAVHGVVRDGGTVPSSPTAGNLYSGACASRAYTAPRAASGACGQAPLGEQRLMEREGASAADQSPSA
jgi:hypothetical protein